MRFFQVLSLQLVLVLATNGALAQVFSNSNFKPRSIPPKHDRQIVASLPVSNDSDLIRAVNDHRNVNFVQGAGVVVTRILPDDNSGLPHQRWYVRLSNGKEIIAIYNSDMGQRLPLQTGLVMALGGEFKMTNMGPMIHWLHSDPKGTRPNGYVIIQGVRYGGN